MPKTRQKLLSNRMKILAQKSVAQRAAAAREEPNTIAPVVTVDNKTMKLAWTKDAEESKKFVRKVTHSKRHLNRLKKENAQAAEGCAKISSMFAKVSSSTDTVSLEETPLADQPSPEELIPEEEFKTKAEKAIKELSIFVVPVENANSEEQNLSEAEMAKYEGVYHYLKAMVDSDMKKMEASILASDHVYNEKSTLHKARNIRQYAKEYLEQGKISLSAQGKHSKRVRRS